MYLSSVEIKNFRSLKDLRVEFQPGLNVLVGRNNTGKTNLLQAIRQALGLNASRGEDLWLERDDFYRDSSTDVTERTISIALTFAGLSDSQRSHFFEIVDFDLGDLSRSTASVRFEATWPKGKRQASIKRTGGPLGADPREVPTKLLESLPITFLPALRDAQACLAPGYRSRLARLLRDLAERKGTTAKDEIVEIFKTANEQLESRPLISEIVDSLQSTTKDLAGSDYSASAIKAAGVEFEKVLRTLQVEMDGAPVGALESNGLGYNNLLYMAVVLEHLKEPEPDESPLFLIEEPEAHLHPQLTMLLADYLSNKTPGNKTPQTIVTTHSPTLAANVHPSRVHVLFVKPASQTLCCNGLNKAGMDTKEQNQLQRMMDITRATLYFAKGVILVEGISEALLVPVLARRLGYDLTRLHISVIPICGVAFETFKKLLDPNVLGIRVAAVTDSDPEVPTDVAWKDALPKSTNGKFAQSDRAKKLLSLFAGHATVQVYCSQLTLEYDLAEAGDDNSMLMAEVWESCFQKTPGTFNKGLVTNAGSVRHDKAMIAWRGICRATHSGSKAEFAHRLAERLSSQEDSKWSVPAFEVPEYLKLAIKYVSPELSSGLSAQLQEVARRG
jgi:putative ATP-dependent endonuclease of OLD family